MKEFEGLHELVQEKLEEFLSQTKLLFLGIVAYPAHLIDAFRDCLARFDEWKVRTDNYFYAVSFEPLTSNGITCHILNVLVVSPYVEDVPYMFSDLGNNRYRVYAMTFNAEIPEFDEMGSIIIEIDEKGNWSRVA